MERCNAYKVLANTGEQVRELLGEFSFLLRIGIPGLKQTLSCN